MIKRKSKLTQEYLKQIVAYDHETGAFFWTGVKKFTTSGSAAGTLKTNGYLSICIDYRLYQAHRLAWLYFYGSEAIGYVDHINGNRSDNRIANLRDVSQVVNMHNVYLPNTNNRSGFRGVYWAADQQRFLARINICGKVKHIGSFLNPEDASRAYLEAKRIQIALGCS